MVEPPEKSVYLLVVARDSMRTACILSLLNILDILAIFK